MSSGKDQLTVSDLIERLKDPHPLVRIHAGTVLGSMGEDGAEAIPTLMDMLNSEELQDRRVAALALGEIGPAAAEAVDALLEAANDDDENLAELAAWALEEIDLAGPQIEAA